MAIFWLYTNFASLNFNFIFFNMVIRAPIKILIVTESVVFENFSVSLFKNFLLLFFYYIYRYYIYIYIYIYIYKCKFDMK